MGARSRGAWHGKSGLRSAHAVWLRLEALGGWRRASALRRRGCTLRRGVAGRTCGAIKLAAGCDGRGPAYGLSHSCLAGTSCAVTAMVRGIAQSGDLAAAWWTVGMAADKVASSAGVAKREGQADG